MPCHAWTTMAVLIAIRMNLNPTIRRVVWMFPIKNISKIINTPLAYNVKSRQHLC